MSGRVHSLVADTSSTKDPLGKMSTNLSYRKKNAPKSVSSKKKTPTPAKPKAKKATSAKSKAKATPKTSFELTAFPVKKSPLPKKKVVVRSGSSIDKILDATIEKRKQKVSYATIKTLKKSDLSDKTTIVIVVTPADIAHCKKDKNLKKCDQTTVKNHIVTKLSPLIKDTYVKDVKFLDNKTNKETLLFSNPNRKIPAITIFPSKSSSDFFASTQQFVTPKSMTPKSVNVQDKIKKLEAENKKLRNENARLDTFIKTECKRFGFGKVKGAFKKKASVKKGKAGII